MIDNPNYNPEKAAEYKEMDGKSRYEKGLQKMLVDNRIRVQRDPSYRESPEIVEEEE